MIDLQNTAQKRLIAANYENRERKLREALQKLQAEPLPNEPDELRQQFSGRLVREIGPGGIETFKLDGLPLIQFAPLKVTYHTLEDGSIKARVDQPYRELK